MRKTALIRLSTAAAVCLIAQLALAQNADRNTAGPTKNQLQLRVAEPRQGASIRGSSIRVVVAYNKTVFGQGQGTKFGEPNFPQPTFDVYLDNTLKQSLKGGETNVAIINSVPAGAHKIAVVAKNLSGEIIDRQEITVTNTEGASAASTSTTTAETSSAPPPQPAAPMPSDSSSMASQPPAAGSTYSRSDMSTQTTTSRAKGPAQSLPKTASENPRLGVIGLALLAAGLWIGRKVR